MPFTIGTGYFTIHQVFCSGRAQKAPHKDVVWLQHGVLPDHLYRFVEPNEKTAYYIIAFSLLQQQCTKRLCF
jgi:hypothetical protein